MCLRPLAAHKEQPERRAVPFGQQHWEHPLANHHRRPNFNQHRNSLDHLNKIQFHPDCCQSPLEGKMFALFASVFECSFLLFATVSALFSIVQPKLQNGLLLLALPIMALIPAAIAGKQQELAAGAEEAGEDGN